jgi:hypothetical protein
VTLTAAERAEKYSHAEPAQPLPLGSAEPTRRYDLVKEFVVAFVVVALLTVVLAVVFSSPDDK